MAQKKKNLIQRFLQVASLPTDTQEERLNKENLMLMSSHFTVVGLVWGVVYWINGLWLPSYIPFSYTILSVISIMILLINKKFSFFRNFQLCLVLLLPFLLHLSLGGFIQSSSVILWAIVCPLAALFFITIREAIYWFSAFIIVIFIAFLFDDEISRYYSWEISDGFIDTLFLLNIIGVSVLVFLVQYYFARNERTLKEEVENQNALLAIQSDQLKELDKMKSNFFANISHEFRTPLTLIRGILRKGDIPSQEDCSIMERNADRLLQLINQLLDLAKLESGKMNLNKQTIDLVQETRKVAQLFGSVAEMKAIQFLINGQSILDFPEGTVFAELDPEKIQKVIANLISNAVKFCPDGGKIDIQIRDKLEFAEIIFANTGEDIPKEQLPLIFNRFHQVESGSTRGYEGTGIGLSLVHEIVVLHGGKISVTSENNIIKFEILLPKGRAGASKGAWSIDRCDTTTYNW